MNQDYYDVVIVGGGATGAGVLWDVTLRGMSAALIEAGDLATGTSGRFHGLLHSGGRYAVGDPESARECIQENTTLRRIAPHAIDAVEGLFVQVQGDDPAYAERWAAACGRAGIPTREVTPRDALLQDPSLSPELTRAFAVPDGSLDSWRLVQANVKAAQARGAGVYLRHRLIEVLQENGTVTGVAVEDQRQGRRSIIHCRMLVNATGPWAAEVGRLAGVTIEMALDRGTMLVFDHHYAARVINRLRPAGDGDILVPVGSVSVFGTSAVAVDSPEKRTTDAAEIERLIALGAEMVPGLAVARVLRTFVGVRPLYRPADAARGQRAISRGVTILDHAKTDGLDGLVTVIGGKLTTYRLMAEKVTDLVAARLGNNTPCRTAEVPLLGPEVPAELGAGRGAGTKSGTDSVAASTGAGTTAAAMRVRRARRLYSYLPPAEAGPVAAATSPLVCECEGADEAEIIAAGRQLDHLDLGDLRRRTRLGMGPCQGTVCTLRAVGVLHRAGVAGTREANRALLAFLADRWRGVRQSPSLEQLRASELTRGLYLGNLNVRGLTPAGYPEGPAATASGEEANR